jgi:hypothetical protein
VTNSRKFKKSFELKSVKKNVIKLLGIGSFTDFLKPQIISSTHQRRTASRKTSQYGHEILQWIVPAFSNEESIVAFMESAVGIPWRNERTKRVERLVVICNFFRKNFHS